MRAVADLPLTARIDGRIAAPARTRRRPLVGGGVAASTAALATASTVTFLSVVVLLPIAALLAAGIGPGFLATITQPEAVAALTFTVGVSLLAVAVDLVFGLVVAWVLVRDDFPAVGWSTPWSTSRSRCRRSSRASPCWRSTATAPARARPGVHPRRRGPRAALRHAAVRRPQRAAGARRPRPGGGGGRRHPRRRFVDDLSPDPAAALLPALVAGGAQAFARALGEFGSVVLISGNLPYRTEVASWWIFTQVENGAPEAGAAVAVVLLAVALVVVVLLRVVGRRAEGRRWKAGSRWDRGARLPGARSSSRPSP